MDIFLINRSKHMAAAAVNPLIAEIHGRTGKTVFYSRYGRTCVRMHVIPRNPDTEAQRIVRRTFAMAVKSWQVMTLEQRDKFNRKARNMNMSGYNLYISEYMRTKRNSMVMQPAGKMFYSDTLQLRFSLVNGKILINTPLHYNFRL